MQLKRFVSFCEVILTFDTNLLKRFVSLCNYYVNHVVMFYLNGENVKNRQKRFVSL